MTNCNRNIRYTSPVSETFLHIYRLMINQLYFSISVGSPTLTLSELYPEPLPPPPLHPQHTPPQGCRKYLPREKIVQITHFCPHFSSFVDVSQYAVLPRAWLGRFGKDNSNIMVIHENGSRFVTVPDLLTSL